jgi:aspartokinase/homoserine dehydrogenase 1
MPARDLRVLKLGGSVLGSPTEVRTALDVVKRERERGRVTLVVSAIGRTTRELDQAGKTAALGDLKSAHELARGVVRRALDVFSAVTSAGTQTDAQAARRLTPLGDALLRLLEGVSLVGEVPASTRDLLLSFGERISSLLVADALTLSGVPAVAVDSRTWTVTDATFGAARVDYAKTREAVRRLAPTWDDRVAVHTGFLGQTADGRTTTLGRNGSDYTATLLASAEEAREVVIWTDVSGVMTADPDLVVEAYPVPHLSYEEALELARSGLGILHPRTIVPLVESGIPLRVKNLARPLDPGTLIDAAGSADALRPACIASLQGMTLLDVEATVAGERGMASPRVLLALARAEIPVWFSAQSARGSSEAVLVEDARADAAIQAITRELGHEIEAREVRPPTARRGVTLITLVAETMGKTPNVAGRFFGALGALGVNVLASAQGATSRSVAAVVTKEDTPIAVRSLHAAFALAREQVSLLVLGKGTVAGPLFEQIHRQAEYLAKEHDVVVKVVGVRDSLRSAFDENGIDPKGVREALGRAGGQDDITAMLDRLRSLPVPVLVDCTAEEGMDRVYIAALERGVHVVSANKKPLAGSLDALKELHRAARRAHRSYRYETTVGASLPVIETLKNIVRTGDRVVRIEASLSGTLGYLANQLLAKVPLSVAVRRAKELGYTEPHPRDDLSGLDAARKAVILARELGLAVSVADVQLTPFVPSHLLEDRDLEGFFSALARFDRRLAEDVERLRGDRKVLRYLATIDPRAADGPRVSVGPVGVGESHPAARLADSQSFVAFYTERYASYPLVVEGAGAGGAVTAAGVLADVLSIAKGVRGS